MISLAPFRYRTVMAARGGPVTRVVRTDVEVMGRPMVQANAFLEPILRQGKAEAVLFGTADGTGTAERAAVACHMAISEALERWAFLAVHASADREAYGFGADPSSNGMAAYPGVWRGQAARRARLEALERFSVISWWDGRLPAMEVADGRPGVRCLRIGHGVGGGEVVVLVRTTPRGAAYGHAAGATVAAAAARAAVELSRMEAVLATRRAQGVVVAAAGFLERRALWFAGEAGREAFERRAAEVPSRPRPQWKPVFDGPIPGPWSRWATVWRCAVEMPTRDYLERDADFFYW